MSLPPLIAAMVRPEFYPHRPDGVQLVQTHISFVLLAGAEVYKIKKAVRFPFLDDVANPRFELLARFTRQDDAIGRFGHPGEIDERVEHVRGGENAEQGRAVDDRQGADLIRAHEPGGFVHRGIGRDHEGLGRHDVGHPLRRGRRRTQIPVRDDAHHAVAAQHGHLPDTVPPEEGADFCERTLRLRRNDLSHHPIANQHGTAFLLRGGPTL